MLHTFKKGGVHPPQNKITAGLPIVDMELPVEVVLPLSQHIGAPAKAVVAKGDKVKRGDVVAEASGFVSARVHTPITGTVTKLDKVKTPAGYMVDAVFIKADDDDHAADLEAIASPKAVRTDEEISALEPKEIVEIVGDAGIVGLGGATFPTKVKLMPPPGSKAEVLVVNAVECEPYLTNDHALMLARPREIIEGVKLLMKATGVERALIGVENNKPDAVEALANAAADDSRIEVVPLRVKYPQGGEKQLIKALTGREVPSGALPVAVGAIVVNVASVYSVYEAVKYGKPLLERVVTVTGPSVATPGNYRVSIGTPLAELINMAGGVPDNTGKVILGGPMMGRAAVNLDTPATKGTSAILLLPAEESERGKMEPCVRCGRCVEVCPMGLEPFLISTLSRLGRFEDAEPQGIMDCIECGSCSFICPSWRPLLDYIRLGKGKVGAMIRARRQLEEKK